VCKLIHERKKISMPLSKPLSRNHISSREIQCKGYHREDGLWDIEASLSDTKTYSFANEDRNGINSGEFIHKMYLRITIDETMTIQAAEASIEDAPFSICGNASPVFDRLCGLSITSGFRKSVADIMGGLKGCTHLRDLLLGPIATTAFQTIRANREWQKNMTSDGEKPAIIDSCHALRGDGPVVEKHWPEFFSKPDS
jgi:hypothetical protein